VTEKLTVSNEFG